MSCKRHMTCNEFVYNTSKGVLIALFAGVANKLLWCHIANSMGIRFIAKFIYINEAHKTSVLDNCLVGACYGRDDLSMAAGRNVVREIAFATGKITLCIGITFGCPGSIPRPIR